MLNHPLLKLAHSDDELRKASLVAGLNLFGLPNFKDSPVTEWAQRLGVDLSKFKKVGGSGLIWSPEVHPTISAEEWAGLDAPSTPTTKAKMVPLTDEVISQLEKMTEEQRENVTMKLSQVVPALTVAGSSMKADADGMPDGIESVEAITFGPIRERMDLMREDADFTITTMPLVLKRMETKAKETTGAWGKTLSERVVGVREFLATRPTLFCFNRDHYISLEDAKKYVTVSIKTPTNLHLWAEAIVGTFDYVFFPSTQKGIDAADTAHIFDPKIRDTDGLVYLGCSEEGCVSVSVPKNADAVFAYLVKEYQIHRL